MELWIKFLMFNEFISPGGTQFCTLHKGPAVSMGSPYVAERGSSSRERTTPSVLLRGPLLLTRHSLLLSSSYAKPCSLDAPSRAAVLPLPNPKDNYTS